MIEVLYIKKHYPEAEIILRIKVNDDAALYKLGNKFGCTLEIADHLLKTAKKLGLTVIGASFHVGCGNKDPEHAFSQALRDIRTVCDAGNCLGYSMKFIDIGGGWKGHSGTESELKQLAKVVNVVLDELFPADQNYEIISEPGTFFVQSAFTLFTPIVGKKVVTETKNNKNINIIHYYIYESVFKSFVRSLFEDEESIPETLEKVKNGTALYPTVVWGNTCDGCDKIREGQQLPDMDIGEWLVFANMGAYSLTLATPFNGFEDTDVFLKEGSDLNDHYQFCMTDQKQWVFLNFERCFSTR